MTKSSAAVQQKCIERAASAKNPMEPLTNFSTHAEYSFYCRRKGEMDGKTLKWAFKLAERNVGPFYKELTMGWQPKAKQNELNKNWARYFVALDKSKNPCGYAMFRFDMDYEHSVLYCYELQIEPTSQRKGLGRYMMDALEQCARHWQMEKVVLTVLRNNLSAMSFFKAVGYTVDESSPDISEKAEYEILSKPVAQ